MINKRGIGNGVESVVACLKVLFRHSPGVTEETHKIPHWGYSAPLPKFELITHWIQIIIITIWSNLCVFWWIIWTYTSFAGSVIKNFIFRDKSWCLERVKYFNLVKTSSNYCRSLLKLVKLIPFAIHNPCFRHSMVPWVVVTWFLCGVLLCLRAVMLCARVYSVRRGVLLFPWMVEL
jgi:hypothetical protein